MEVKKDVNIVFITPILEHPPAGGPFLRVENSIKALADVCMMHIISLVGLNRIGGKGAEDFYRRYSSSFLYAPSVNPDFRLGMVKKIVGKLRCLPTRLLYGTKRATQDYEFMLDADYIVDYMNHMKIDTLWFGYGNDGIRGFPMVKRIKQRAPHIKIIFDTANVESITFARGLPYASSAEDKQKIVDDVAFKRHAEASWVKICDVTTAVCHGNADYYRSLTRNPQKIKLFSNVLDKTMYAHPSSGSGPESIRLQQPALYLAGYFGPKSPMHVAAQWLIDSVMPLVLKAIPQAHLYLIGRGSDSTFKNFKHPSVTVVGPVDSVLPYLFQARVALTPLKSEGGPHIKVLEAGIVGIPIVSTTMGAEGLDVEHEKHLLIADEPEVFAEAIMQVLRDEVLATTLVDNCKKLVEEQYTLDRLRHEAVEILTYVQNHASPGG